MHFAAPANATFACRSLQTSALSETSPTAAFWHAGKEPMPGTHSPCHAQKHRIDICIRGTNDSDFFFVSLFQIAPDRRVPLTEHQRRCLCLVLKTGRMGAKPGKQSQGTPWHARGWARVGAEEGDSHHPLVENNPVSHFWASACAEAWGGGARDQGSPSRFLWLFLGRSFDLFLRKTAETQGIGSLAVCGAWQRRGDGG